MEGSAIANEALDKLPAHVNTVLIQLGRLFQRSNSSDLLLVYGRFKTQAHERTAKANRQFHEALDDIEIEILNAKAVLERDLAALRAKREERENAIRAEKLRVAGQNMLDSIGTRPEDEKSKGVLKKEPSEGTSQTPGPRKAVGGALVDSSEKTGLANSAIKSEPQTATHDPSGASLTQNQTANGQTPQELRDLGISGDIFNDALGSTDLVNVATDSDFDSMFNEASGNAADSLDFGIDFSGTDSNLLSGSNPMVSAENIPNGDLPPNEDINSLLPGLESLVNAEGDGAVDDFTMIDIPTGEGTGLSNSAPGQQQPTRAFQNQSKDVTATDDNFDMLFGSENFEDDGGSGAINSIDFDEWFN